VLRHEEPPALSQTLGCMPARPIGRDTESRAMAC
jgi:hypothetical protein